MDILKLFFWYCKEQKIMDIMYLMYQEKKPTKMVYDKDNITRYQKELSLKEYLIHRIKSHGFFDLFWGFQDYRNSVHGKLIKSERYKKARSKWNAFVKNNVRFSEDYVKIGDIISITFNYGPDRTIERRVIGMPKNFDGRVIVSRINNDTEPITIYSYTYEGRQQNEEINLITSYADIKINGESKTPKFFIKKRRKVYGVD